MANTLDELLVGLGFDYDPEDLEQFNKDLDSTVSTIKSFAKVVVAGTAALIGFTAVTTAATDKQAKLSKQTGVSVDQIDALEFALKRSGGESSSLGTSLEQLSIRLSEASRGVGSGIEAFGILGISVTDANGKLKETDDVLLEVSDSLQRFSKAEQIELADKLGLKDSILLLQEGSKGINALTQEAKALGVTTKEDAKLSEDFQDSLADIFQIIKQGSRVLTRSFIPILQNIATSMTDWWKVNREIIEQNLPKFIDRATLAIKLLTLASLSFIAIKLVNVLLTALTLFRSLSLAVLATNFAIAAIPIAIATVIAAFALLAEDAKVFFEGGESFIGKMIEKYPEWAAEIRTLAAVFATVAELTGMISDGWGEIFKLFTSGTAIEDFKLVMNQLGRDISDVFKQIKMDIFSFFDDLWKDITSSFENNFIKPIEDKIDALKDLFTDISFNPFSDDETENIKQTVDTVTQIVLNEDDVPVFNDIKVLIDELPKIPEVALNEDDVPVFNDIKVLIDELPKIPEVVLNVEDVPVFNDIKVLIDELPSLEQAEISIDDLPNIDDIMISITGMPSIEDVTLNMPNIPVIDDIAVDDLRMIEGLASNQDTFTSSSIENISKDSSQVNNKSQVNIGDIKVSVTGITDNPIETGKVVAKEIQIQLEPLFKQASQDLNSAVEL